jgi:hypothetical protein
MDAHISEVYNASRTQEDVYQRHSTFGFDSRRGDGARAPRYAYYYRQDMWRIAGTISLQNGRIVSVATDRSSWLTDLQFQTQLSINRARYVQWQTTFQQNSPEWIFLRNCIYDIDNATTELERLAGAHQADF